MNRSLRILLACLLSALAIGANSPATGQAVKPWESYGIRLDGSPYDIKVRVQVSMTRATEQTEIAHWQGYWPANLAAQVSRQPEAQALGDLQVYARQSGCAAPCVFGHIGGKYDTTFLYFQDLGAVGRLMDFMGEVPEPAVVVEGDRFGWRGVGTPGSWKPAREVLVSEGYLFLKHGTLATPTLRAQWYLQCLAALYEKIAPKPAKVDDWEALAARTSRWLDDYPNWVKSGGFEFVPAYTNATYGGELQVLTELAEAAYRTDKQSKLSQRLLAGLPAFFQADIGTIVSYSPYQAQLNGDSDWLMFNLAKVGALAADGHEPARKILLPSLKRAVQFAHHVNYRFPIFYSHASALPVKEPADGVERDAVLGYAYAMMLGYDLFHDAEFLEEAKRALDHGDADEFAMPYQMQIAPMGMAACGRLYKLTGEKKYLDRAQCYLAYFLHQTWFYQATWGFSAGMPTFFALNPGQGANYSAPLEQHQAAAYLDEALALFGNDLPAPSHALAVAFIKHSIGLTRYTYPDRLPPGALAPKPFRSPWPGANLADAPIPVEDLEGGLRQSGLVGQEIYGAGAAADFARLAKKYGTGEERFVPSPINVFPRAVWMMRNGDGLFSCYHGKETPDLRFTLPHGFHSRLTQEPGTTRIFLHADDGTPPGDYDGYVEAGTNGTFRTYHIAISLTPQNGLAWDNSLIYSKNAWQIFMNSPRYGVDGKGVTLEIGPGKNWTWIAIPNVRLDAARAGRIKVVADAVTPKTRWYVKLTCDLMKDGRIIGGPDDLSPFDVKTTTGTFTCDLGALLAKNFPGQPQIDLRYIQIGMEGDPGSRVHIAKLTIE